MKATAPSSTIVRRQPRAIGNMRFNSRAPPSIIVASTSAPSTSRIGWANRAISPMTMAKANHTPARCNSCATSGLRTSLGPGAST